MRNLFWRDLVKKVARAFGIHGRLPPKPAPTIRNPRRAPRPGVETLEDRTMPAVLNLVVTGNELLTFNEDVEIQSITGDGLPDTDSLTLQTTGHVHFSGNAMGGGLHNLSIVAPQIAIDSGLSIVADGDILFTATQAVDVTWAVANSVLDFQFTQSQASIDIGQGANISGHNVSLQAQASTLKSAILNFDLDPNSNPTLQQQINLNEQIQYSGNAAAVVSEAQATITLHNGVSIAAVQNLALQADALADAQITTTGKFLGVTFGRTAPTATITVAGGTHLNAGQSVLAQSQANSALAVTTVVPAQGDAANISLSIANNDSTSLVDIQDGAIVQAPAVDLKTKNTNAISNVASATGYPNAGNAGVGTTVALGIYQSHATTQVSGDIYTGGIATISSESTNTTNQTRSAAQVANPLPPSSIRDSFVHYLGTQLLPLRGSPAVGVAAAAALVHSGNEAKAIADTGASVFASSMTIDAKANDHYQVAATGNAADASSVAVGGAVAVSDVTNKATANIGPNAEIKVPHALNVTATAAETNPIAPFDPALALSDTDVGVGADRISEDYADAKAIGALKIALNPLGGFLAPSLSSGQMIGTSFVQGGGQAPAGGVFVAGGVNLLAVHNQAEGRIAQGAQVNQNFAADSNDQDVKLDAAGTVQLTNLTGLESALDFAADGPADVAVGGQFSGTFADNSAVAVIADGAAVDTIRDVSLHSKTTNNVLQVVQAGAAGHTVAVDGAASVLRLGQRSLADIEDTAQVHVGRDVLLTAENVGSLVNVAGGVAAGGPVGVGLSGAITIVGGPNNAGPAQTHASISNLEAGVGAPGNVTAGHHVNLDGHAALHTTSVAVSGGSSQGSINPLPADAEKHHGLDFGFGVSGDAAINDLDTSVEASIRDIALVQAPDEIHLQANDSPVVAAGAGAVAFGNHFGIGGAYARNDVNAVTRAVTQNTTLAGNDFTLTANHDTSILSYSAGGAGTKADLAILGSVNHNDVHPLAEAALGANTVAPAVDQITLSAHGELTVVSNAGASAATAQGFLAAGAAADLGSLTNSAHAYIGSGANVSTPHDLLISGTTHENVTSIVASTADGGAGTQNRFYHNSGPAIPFSSPGENAGGNDTLVSDVALGDIDGDGKLDLVTGNFGQFNRVYHNDNGQFGPCKEIDGLVDTLKNLDKGLPNPEAFVPDLTLAIALADVDGDGDLDVVSGNLNRPSRVHVNDGHGNFTLSAILDARATTAVAVADLNHDGRPDIITANFNQPTRVYFNSGNGTFGAGHDLPGAATFATSVAVADVDNDNDNDIIVGNVGFSPGSVIDLGPDGANFQNLLNSVAVGAAIQFVTNDGNGNFANPVDLGTDHLVTRSLAVADVNNDGNIDVIAGNALTGSRLYLGNGTGTFAAGVTISDIGLLTTDVTLADVDGDGNLDLVTANLQSPNRYYLGDGQGDFHAGVDITSDVTFTLAIVAGDIDGGDVDIVTGSGKPALGAAGAGSYFDVGGDAQAFIADGAIIGTPGKLQVTAHDESDVTAIAHADATSGFAGVAAAAASPNLTTNVLAKIDAATINVGGDVSVDATAAEHLRGYAAGTTTADDVSLLASGVVNRSNTHVVALIGANAQVTTLQNVIVHAAESTDTLGVAGGYSNANFTGVGASGHLDWLTKSVTAHVDSGATVLAGQDVTVTADSTENLQSITAGMADGVTLAIAGSVGAAALTKSTHATIGGTVKATGDVVVAAASESNWHPLAGAQASGQTGAIGGSAGLFDVQADTQAVISGGAHVDALSNNAPAQVYTGERDGLGQRATLDVHGVVVSATEHEILMPVATGGANAGGLGISGSATGYYFSNLTRAAIDGAAQVNLNDAGAVSDQTVVVQAWNETDIKGMAGATSTANVVGIGGAADGGQLNKHTEAAIDGGAQIDAKHNVEVRALDDEDITSFTMTVAAGGAAGISAQAAVYQFNVTTSAHVSGGAKVHATDNIFVLADAKSEIDIAAGGIAVGGAGGIGASGGITLLNKTTTASIDTLAEVNADALSAGSAAPTGNFSISFVANPVDPLDIKAPSVSNPSADDDGLISHRLATPTMQLISGIAVSAVNRDDVATLTSAAGGSALVAAAASGGVVQTNNATTAQIASGAKVNANTPSAGETQTVLVASGSDEYLLNVTDAMSVGPLLSATAGITFNQIGDQTIAAIDGAEVHAMKNVLVQADASEDVLTISLGLAPGFVAGAGAGSLVKIDNHTGAAISGGATVHAGQNVLVAAHDETDIDQFAGSLAIGGVGGIALALTAEDILKDTTAVVSGGANVTADATGQGLSVPGQIVAGVVVMATAHTDIFDVAAGGSGAGVAGVAGSATLHKLDETTEATIAGSAIVHDGLTDSHMVFVFAANPTDIFGLAGAVSASGVVGAGGGLDAAQIVKHTRAAIEEQAHVNAHRAIEVRALSDEDIFSISANLTFAGTVSIAGALGAYTLPVSTEAIIAGGAVVTTPGSVVVNADDFTQVNFIAGVLSVSGNAPAAGGSGGLVVTDKHTVAAVDGATVTALGQNQFPAVTSNTGAFDVAYQADPSRIPGMVVAGLLEVIGFVFENPLRTALAEEFTFQGDYDFLDLTPVSAPSVDPDLSGKRVVTPLTTTVHGLAVTATSRDHVETLAVGLSSGAIVTPEFSAAALVTSNETGAFIGDGSLINPNNANAVANQSVLVAAGSDTSFFALSGGAALASDSSVATLGGAFNISAIDNTTKAGIGAGAQVNAKGDVAVKGLASEDVLVFAASIAAGSDSSVLKADLSVDYISVKSVTHAFIGNGATVNAGGNALVHALNDTDIDLLAGAGALGGGVAGAGASLTVAVVSKDTQAFVGEGATVNAKGNSGGTLEVFNGVIKPALGTEQIHGVAVQAHSTESIFGLAAAGTTSSKFGLSGAGTVAIVDSDTAAFIEMNAKINESQFGANSAQSVNVSAANEIDIFGLPVNVTKGTITLGLGIDLGIIDNDTTAQVRGGATVHAKQDIDVHALDQIQADSFVANIGRPDKFGINITMSLYSLRADFTNPLPIPLPSEIDIFEKLNGVSANNIQSDIDGPVNDLTNFNIDGILNGVTQSNGQGGVRDTLNQYDGSLPGLNDVKLGLAKAPTDAVATAENGNIDGSGTTAVVSGTLEAGRDVIISADERSNFASDTVTATDLMYYISKPDDNSIAISNDRAYVFAHTIAVASLDHATIHASRDVSIQGNVENDQSLTASSGGNFLESTTGALVLDHSQVTADRNAEFKAHADIFDTTWAILPRCDGLQIKSGSNTLTGTTEARVEGHSTVTADKVTVQAIDDDVALTVANAMTVGLDGKEAGKLPNVGAAMGFNTISRNVAAAVENSSLIATAGDVLVSAVSNPLAVSVGLGVAEAEQYLVAAGSVALNAISNTVDAHLLGEGTVSATGKVRVEAKDDATVVSIGGSLAIASGNKGKAAVGASISRNAVQNKVLAYVAGMPINGAPDVVMTVTAPTIEIVAVENVDISAIAVGGQKAEYFALGGSYTENHLANDIQAYVGNDATLTATNKIDLTAQDNGTIVAIAGQVGIATSGAAVGAAVSANKIEDNVHAYITTYDPDQLFQQVFDTTLTAPTIVIAADNNQQIHAVAAGGTYGDKAALTGSFAQNIIVGSTKATMDDQPNLNATSTLTVQAKNNAYLFAVSGAAAISQGKVAAAGAVAENIIGGTTEAQVSATTITANHVNVLADDNSHILATSGAGAYSDGLTGVGATSQNKMNGTTNATITGAFTNITANDVLVEAHGKSTVEAIIVALTYADKVALAGSVTVNDDSSQVNASIKGLATVDANTITVQAKNEPTLKSLAGAVSASSTAAAGDATSKNLIAVKTMAKIGQAHVTGGSVFVNADTAADIETIAVIGTGAGDVAASAAQFVNDIKNSTDARITGDFSNVGGAAIHVGASDDSNIKAFAGSVALSKEVAGAAAVGLNQIANQVTALIENGTVTGTTVDVIASSNDDGNDGIVDVFNDDGVNDDIQAIVIGGAGSGQVALSGSVALNQINNVVTAEIGSQANVTATSAVHVRAADDSGIRVLAGNVQASGTFAAGAAVAKNDSHSIGKAIVHGATVTAPTVDVTSHTTGNIKSVAACGGGSGTVAADAGISLNTIGNQSVAELTGGAHVVSNSAVTVSAEDTSHIVAITGGAAGAGTVAIGAAVSTNDVANTVRASVRAGSYEVHHLNVTAEEQATLEVAAIGIAGAGAVALAGGVSVNKIKNTTQADLSNDAYTPATGNMTIHAEDHSTISAVTAQAAAAATVGAGAAVTVNDIHNHVLAFIDGSQVTANNGSIFVTSHSTADIGEIAVGANGGLVGVGASVSVNSLESTTEAYIHHASVSARGNIVVAATGENLLSVITGQASAGFVAVGGTVVVNSIANTTRAYIDDTGDGQSVAAGGQGAAAFVSMWDPDSGAESLQAIQGLAVIASSVEKPRTEKGTTLPTVTAINGAGGFVGVNGLVSVTTVDDKTDAFIARSHINSEASFGGQVIVRAHTDDYLNIVSGGGSGGFVGVGATVDRTVITSTTRAFITNQDPLGNGPSKPTFVYGSGVEVSTVSREVLDEVIIGFAGGAVAVAGTVSVADIRATSDAFVTASTVNSKGSLDIMADDTSRLSPRVGTIVGGAVGIGAAISINSIGTGVHANVISSNLNATGAMTIQADSDESVTPLVGTGAIGLAALAGAVSVSTIETTTEARVLTGGDPSQINQDPKFQLGGAYNPGSGQSVTIRADDTAKLDDGAGTISGGAVALGAAVDVGAIRNRTVAQVGNEVEIDAVGNVAVLAHADHEMASTVVAFSGGLVGLSGAFSVLSLGGATASQANDEFNKPGKDKPDQTLLGQTDDAAKTPNVSDDLNYSPNNDDPLTKKAGDHVNQLSKSSVDDEVNGGGNNDRIVAAFLSDASQGNGATIHAHGNIDIRAGHDYHVKQFTGDATGGLGAFGAGISVTSINNTTKAYLGTHNTLEAGGDILIRARDEDKANSQSTFTSLGAAFGAIAVDANVAVVTLNSTADAHVASHAKITKADVVTVYAKGTTDLNVDGQGYGAGAAAAGGVFVQANLTNTVDAHVDDSAALGSNNVKVGGLVVHAEASNTVDTHAEVGHLAGLGAINYGAAKSNILTGGASATIGDVTIDATGQVEAHAEATNTATAKVEELALAAVSGGAAKPKAEVVGTVTALVANGADIDAGSLVITAEHTSTATAQGEALGAGVVSGTAADVQATVNVDTNATVGNSKIVTVGATNLTASANATATALSGQIAVGAGVGGASVADAHILGDVMAQVVDNADITAGDLYVTASRTANATTDSRAVGVGFGTVNAADGKATIEGEIDAVIGNATVTTANSVDVEASANQTASAKTGQVALALVLAAGGSNAEAKVLGTVQGRIAAGADVTAGDFLAGDVIIRADSTNKATSDVGATADGIALLGYSAAHALANIDVDTFAYIDAGHTLAKGDVTVTATSTNQTDATGDGEAVGAVAVGGVEASSTVTGVTRSRISGVVIAQLGSVDLETIDDDSHAFATVTTTGGGIVTVTAGEAVANLYTNDDNLPNLRAWIDDGATVTAGGNVTVHTEMTGAQASASATGTSVSLVHVGAKGGGSTATANLSPQLRAVVGDGAEVHANGGVTIEAIQADSNASATATTSDVSILAGFSGGIAEANAEADIAGTVGQAIVTAGGTLKIRAISHNEAETTAQGLSVGGLLGVGNVLATTSAGKTVSAGAETNADLNAGALIIEAIGTDIGDAAAKGTGAGLVTADSTIANTDVGSDVNAYLGEGATAKIAGNAWITGKAFVDGDATASAKAFGAVEIGESRAMVYLLPHVSSRLDQGAFVDAGGDVTVEAAAGGVPLQNGPSTSEVTAKGANAGVFVGALASKATIWALPTVKAYVAGPSVLHPTSIDADGSVLISSASQMKIDSASDNSSNNGLASVGVAIAHAYADTASEAYVGANGRVAAGGAVTLQATTDNSAVANATGHAGSITIYAKAAPDANADIDYTTRAHLDDGAELQAGGTATLDSDTTSSASSTTTGQAGGLGAPVEATNGGARVGHAHANTQSEVGAGAQIDAATVNLIANVTKTAGFSEGYAYGNGGGGTVNSYSRVELNDVADVTIDADAQITGHDAVTINAIVQLADSHSYSYALGDAATEPNGHAYRDIKTDSTVNGTDNALITTHDLQVKARFNGSNDYLFAAKDGAFGGHITGGDYSPFRTISWDTDVTLTSGPAILIIGPNGNLVLKKNIDYHTQGNTIIVHNIENKAPGTALFQVNAVNSAPTGLVVSQNMFVAKLQNKPIVHGVGPLFTFVETFDTVHIENQSSMDLAINKIEVVHKTMTPDPEVTIDAQTIQLDVTPADASYTPVDVFGFDVKHTFGPTKLDILNTTVNASNLMVLKDAINNPLGTSILHSAGGSIFNEFGNTKALVRTNVLDIDAEGDVGSSANRIKLELVQSAGRPTVGNVNADGQVWLDLRGLQRDKALNSINVGLGDVSGSTVDILLEGAQKQITIGAAINYSIDVLEKLQNKSTKVENRFRPIPGLATLTTLDVDLFGSGSTAIDATYAFGDIQSASNIEINAASAPKKVNVVAGVNVTGSGKVNVHTNANINVTESVGDLRVGRIGTTAGNVALKATAGSIIDQNGDPEADVQANGITLIAHQGGVGTLANPLDVNSAKPTAGSLVSGVSRDGFYLVEVEKDLNVGLIISKNSDVNLTTLRGSIVDGLNEDQTNIEGVNITLTANHGNLGESKDYLEICTGEPTPGVANLHADGSIWVSNCGDLKVIGAVGGGTVSVNVGMGGKFELVDVGTLSAKSQLTILAEGGVLLHAGTVSAAKIDILGGGDNDEITLAGTNLIGQVRILGNGGNDTIKINAGGLQPVGGVGNVMMHAARLDATALTIDGGAGNDTIDASGATMPLSIHGGGGDDVVSGGLGNDRIWGDAGNDVLNGGAGNDFVYAGDGDDHVNGQAGRDVLFGGLGSDVINGGLGEDALIGGDFKDANNSAVIDRIMAAWSADQPYASRVEATRRAGLSVGRVVDDRVANQLFGGGEELDWFWSFDRDTWDRTGSEKLR